MKNIFIDSNIWLSLYSFSNDDLDQFMKLKDLIGNDVVIWLPEQVCDEVTRNRENKIKDTMSRFEAWKFEIPNIVKGYSLYKDFKIKVNEITNAHKEVISKIKNDISKKTLHADNAISTIFEQCIQIQRTNEITNAAYMRYQIGNPPGKDNKIGDAINWISLLESVPSNEDLFFICADGDFQSSLDKNRFNQFLTDEWKKRKHADIFLFKSLTEFFNTHLKAIQLKNELVADKQKDALIEILECSYSFSQTHSVISQLSKFCIWTDLQVSRILNAVSDNLQVGMIKCDPDVSEFIESLHVPSVS